MEKISKLLSRDKIIYHVAKQYGSAQGRTRQFVRRGYFGTQKQDKTSTEAVQSVYRLQELGAVIWNQWEEESSQGRTLMTSHNRPGFRHVKFGAGSLQVLQIPAGNLV